MTATIIDGRAIAGQVKAQVAERAMALVDRGIQPGLAAVLVGDDEASRIYLAAKHKACSEVGMRSEQVDLPSFITEGEVLATIRRLNRQEYRYTIQDLLIPRSTGSSCSSRSPGTSASSTCRRRSIRGRTSTGSTR